MPPIIRILHEEVEKKERYVRFNYYCISDKAIPRLCTIFCFLDSRILGHDEFSFLGNSQVFRNLIYNISISCFFHMIKKYMYSLETYFDQLYKKISRNVLINLTTCFFNIRCTFKRFTILRNVAEIFDYYR